MTEVLFYHMQRRPVDAVLPPLLEKTLEKGWRAVVQSAFPERLSALDAHLWTYRDESFLPHAAADDPEASEQPVLLAADDGNLNAAAVRFLIDGAEIDDAAGYERIVYLFDGRDEEGLGKARAYWKTMKDAGHDVTYWLEGEDGRWQKKA